MITKFTKDKVKRALWGYSSNKSPNLDGLGFKFLK